MRKYTHFLGLGGIGMSALAHILLEQGEAVSGIDQGDSLILESLKRKGAIIGADFDSDTPVVYSSAIREDHPAFQKAKKQGCPLFHRSQFLGKLMERQRPLLVSGTHGKTSAASLLVWTLIHAGLFPSYAVGGILLNTKQNGGFGTGPYFVAEADESDGSFLNYTGEAGMITNLEKDHLDYWETEEKLCRGLRAFGSKLNTLFWCKDDPLLSSLGFQGHSYGFSDEADWRLLEVTQEGMSLHFTVSHRGHLFTKIMLPLVGKHQALNALAVWGLSLELGISQQKVREAFLTFRGVQRRLEKKGEARGALFYDDYAHHPTAIKALLSSLKQATSSRRLIAIFQPHRFTRTRDMMKGFSRAFSAADLVYIMDIYAAGEKPLPGISGQALSQKIPGSFFKSEEDILETVKAVIQKGDVVVTIGAGSITSLGPKLLAALK